MQSKDTIRSRAYQRYQQGNHGEAVSDFQKLIELDDSDADAWTMLGVINAQSGYLDEAGRCFRKVTRLTPQNPAVFNNLGNVLRLKQNYSEALEYYNEAVRLNPGYADVHNNIGLLYLQTGNNATAVKSFLRALELKPDYTQAWNNLSTAYYECSEYRRAAEAAKKAVSLHPGYAEAWNNGGNALLKLDQENDAIACFDKALQLNPQLHQAHHALGGTWFWLGDIDKAIEHYRESVRINPEYLPSQTNLAYCLNCDPDASAELIRDQHLVAGRLLTSTAGPESRFSGDFDPERRLRIGYVSPDFREHPVAFFITPILRNHDSKNLSVYCYSDAAKQDRFTADIESAAQHWRDIHTRNTDEVFDLIRNDRIDILVDLAGYSTGNRLEVFARRAAPVQVTYLGYPNTTGLSMVDFRLTDSCADPARNPDDLYTEELVRVDPIFAPYLAPDFAPEVNPAPVLADGRITLGSLHGMPKLNDQVLSLWSEILATIPNSRLMLYRYDFTDHLKAMLRARLERCGIDQEKIVIRDKSHGYKNHLLAYNDIDIALDTFPWSSHTTSCEALWMGVPVVTLAGKLHAGRMSASVLEAVGLDNLLVAESRPGYVDLVRQLSQDVDSLSTLRLGLRDRMRRSPLCDHAGFTRKLEERYRVMWRQRCRKETKPA